MATTYATNTEIRGSFPVIDDLLPKGRTNGAHTSGGATLTVDSTTGFPFAGSIVLLDSAGSQKTLAYTKKTATIFYLTVVTISNIGDNTEFSTGEYQLDTLRAQAKGWVDSVLTHPSIPADFKLDIEAKYVFYLVTRAHRDPEVRKWGAEIMTELMTSIIPSVKRDYPAAIRNNLAIIPEEDWTDSEKSFYLYGSRV